MKEYLLLRNNKESGPYSLDELKQLGLKAYDLVWIENKSYSWKYPSEINELAIFAPALEVLVLDNNSGDLLETTEELQPDGNRETWLTKETNTVAVQQESRKTHGHVVTLRPRIENIQIKTIKSVAQPNIVKVEIRDRAALHDSLEGKPELHSEAVTAIPETHAVSSVAGVYSNGYELHRTKFNLYESLRALSDSNKMELIVLMIATLSLLAVAFLLITAGY